MRRIFNAKQRIRAATKSDACRSRFYNTFMLVPSSVADVERMIAEKVQENVHLDYKASPAADPGRPNEIAKDVSSFANSDGGVLIYGVEEEKGTGFPIRTLKPASTAGRRYPPSHRAMMPW